MSVAADEHAASHPSRPAADARRPRDLRVPTVGMVGGGQLARMTCQAAIGLGVGFRVLAASAGDSAALAWRDVRVGSHRSLDDLLAFATDCDVTTFDHEHVPGQLLRELDRAGVTIRPGADALRFAQDKLAMRDRLTAVGVACPRYAPVDGPVDVQRFAADAGWPVVLKAVSGGYDGKGVWVCTAPDEVARVITEAAARGVRLFVEEHVGFARELSALVARSPHGQGAAYPVVQTVQRDGICREVLAPAPNLDPDRAASAQALALRIAAELDVTGLLAVELFDTAGGLVVNELAMRPHNSGHWTIDGARTSQFEQHLRAVLDLPLGATDMVAPHVVMANLLGGDDPDLFGRYTHVLAADPGVKLHNYGKTVRRGRKIGHLTVCGDDLAGLRDRARRAANYLRWGDEDAERWAGEDTR